MGFPSGRSAKCEAEADPFTRIISLNDPKLRANSGLNAPQAAFCVARAARHSSTMDLAGWAPICGGLNLFYLDVEIFLSPCLRSKVNTLGVNYSILLIHPEDFTSSDGKTTLGTAIAREPPNFALP